MEFPALVYKKDGPYQCKGGTFDYAPVNDEDELEARLADGWLLDLAEVTGEAKAAAPVDDNAPPTREELEAKAKELGINIQASMKDSTITRKIAEALAQKG